MDERSFNRRTDLYKALCEVMDSEEFCDEDPTAREEARKIQDQIDKLDLESLSPRQRLHAEIEKDIANEVEEV